MLPCRSTHPHILNNICWQEVHSCLLLLDLCLLFFSSHMGIQCQLPSQESFCGFHRDLGRAHKAKHLLLSTTGKWMVSFRKKGKIGEVTSASNKMPSKYSLPERQWNCLLHCYHVGQFFIHHIAMIMTWLTDDCSADTVLRIKFSFTSRWQKSVTEWFLSQFTLAGSLCWRLLQSPNKKTGYNINIVNRACLSIFGNVDSVRVKLKLLGTSHINRKIYRKEPATASVR